MGGTGDRGAAPGLGVFGTASARDAEELDTPRVV